MSADVEMALKKLRAWLFENLYNNNNIKNVAKTEEKKAQKVVEVLFKYYLDNIDKLPGEYKHLIDIGEEKNQVVADYISGMTDDFAIYMFKELFVPIGWKIKNEI